MVGFASFVFIFIVFFFFFFNKCLICDFVCVGVLSLCSMKFFFASECN